ncbi:MAG: hypothetical protein BWZ07_01619 [Alphaproteobacteria bacterium ADurb.BinA280]|nr:MAG: hypothetical protein BWZ07_01619 [Alphaproteobacteria bacterium ADurb.BinA280]
MTIEVVALDDLPVDFDGLRIQCGCADLEGVINGKQIGFIDRPHLR